VGMIMSEKIKLTEEEIIELFFLLARTVDRLRKIIEDDFMIIEQSLMLLSEKIQEKKSKNDFPLETFLEIFEKPYMDYEETKKQSND
jgi:hypothetical protein